VPTTDIAHCPTCGVNLGGQGRYHVALGHCMTHSAVTGHECHVIDGTTGEVVDRTYGEPSLPLWD